MNQCINISFEVFPPNNPEKMEPFYQTCALLNELDPAFISVTFGAAGGAQTKTQNVVQYLAKQGIPVTPHLSCVNMTKARLENMLEIYKLWGVSSLIVIRGDINADCQFFDFHYANELIEYIRHITGDYFHITVAAYPEFHPQSTTVTEDFVHFQKKAAAGANRAITQFFFNTDAYFNFLEQCEQLNINIPIIPGIMPIHDYSKLQRFAASCGAEMPLWLRKPLESLINEPILMRAQGIKLIHQLCRRLVAGGAQGLHFYTLNQIEPTYSIYSNLMTPQSELQRNNHLMATL